jgi:putative ABC transport system permease protein
VQDEVSYDRFHERGNRLYRVVLNTTTADGNDVVTGATGMPQGPAFAADIPEVEGFCRIKGYEMLFRKKDEVIYQQVMYVDTSFFRLFSFGLLSGNSQTLLNDPRSVVVTDEIARKYFGTTDVLNRLLAIDAGGSFEQYRITGVVKTPPINSSIRFDVLRPFVASLPPNRKDWNENDWSDGFLNTFLLLRSGRNGVPANPVKAERTMATVFAKYAGSQLALARKEFGVFRMMYHLQAFTAMHLDARYELSNGLSPGSSSVYSYILSGIAGLILLVAGINFVNLTLARSLRRGKEIGVRKVIGSTRAQLVGQFLGESLLLTLLAFIPAVLLVYGLLPQFSTLANKQLAVAFLFTPQNIGLFFGLMVVVALLAGAYPALVLSGFSPVQTLYGRLRLGGRNGLAKSLMVVQFAIAVFLLIGTAVLHGQFQFIRTANVGYETANRVRVYIPWGREQRGELLQATLQNQPGVQVVTRRAGGRHFSTFRMQDKPIKAAIERIDDQYLRFLNVPVVQGRALTYTNPLDTVSNILVNETFAKKFLNASQPAVGQVVDQDGGAKTRYIVVGVVRDYQYGGLRDNLEPMLWQLGKPNQMNQLYAKLDPAKTQLALQTIERQFKTLIPLQPFSVHFMEDDRLENYADDARWTQIITWSSVLAILISALGLFGLVSLTVEARTKEIGIRKVLGADVAEITRLLSVNFLVLIGIACLIAMPVGWYAARQWLDTFVFRMEFGWWIFAGTWIFVMVVAGLTISIQAIRAALMNPVKSLRSD